MDINIPDMNEIHLEPRVAKLETGLETLTRNVSELAAVMRENAVATNTKIDNLIVSVTQAQAPKKTEWGVLISAFGLILALGAAVLVPLNNSTQENKNMIEACHQVLVKHMELDMHPVGCAKVQALEKAVSLHDSAIETKVGALDLKLQKETSLALEASDTKIADLDLRVQREFNLLNTAMDLRMSRVEKYVEHHDFADVDELRALKMQIMLNEIKPGRKPETNPPTK